MAEPSEWDLVIDQVVVLSHVYGVDVCPRTAQEVHDAWVRLVSIIAERAEARAREVVADRLRDIAEGVTYDAVHDLADELAPEEETDGAQLG